MRRRRLRRWRETWELRRAIHPAITGGEITWPNRRNFTAVTATAGARRRLTRWLIVIGILAVIAFGGWRLWQYTNGYEATDDAQIDGHINSISSRLTGTVVDIRTEDEQFVKQGDVLVKLDPKDYQVAVTKAEADLADAEAALETSRTNVPIVSVDTASQLKTAQSSRTDATAAVAGAERQLRAAQARLLSTWHRRRCGSRKRI